MQSNEPVICARAFHVRVLAGQEEAYARYLREVVEPIDAMAHEAGVFRDGAAPAGDAPTERITQATAPSG